MRDANYRRGKRSARGHVEPAALAVNAFHQALQATMMFVPAMLTWLHMVAGTSVPRQCSIMMMLHLRSHISKIKNNWDNNFDSRSISTRMNTVDFTIYRGLMFWNVQKLCKGDARDSICHNKDHTDKYTVGETKKTGIVTQSTLSRKTNCNLSSLTCIIFTPAFPVPPFFQ